MPWTDSAGRPAGDAAAQLAETVEREIAANPALVLAPPRPGRMAAAWDADEVERAAAPPRPGRMATAWDADEVERAAAPVSPPTAILAEAAVAAHDRRWPPRHSPTKR